MQWEKVVDTQKGEGDQKLNTIGMDSRKIKEEIIKAGEMAVRQLIKVAREDIIKHDPNDDLSADKLKNAAATKKLAIFDAFEILKRIEDEEEKLNSPTGEVKQQDKPSGGFAERRAGK